MSEPESPTTEADTDPTPSRDDFRRMSAAEVNDFLASRGLSVRVVDRQEADPRNCIECGEPWPCEATVTRRKDGIPHRLGFARADHD